MASHPVATDVPADVVSFESLPELVLVRIVFAVGLDVGQTLAGVSHAMRGAVQSAELINARAWAQVRRCIRRWVVRRRVHEINGMCSGCGGWHVHIVRLECSFCAAPFCSRACMVVAWNTHKRSCGWPAARQALRERGVHVPRAGGAVCQLLHEHGLHHLLPIHKRQAPAVVVIPVPADAEDPPTGIGHEIAEEVD